MDSLTRIRLVKYCEKMQIQKSEAIRKAIDFLTDDNEVEDGKMGIKSLVQNMEDTENPRVSPRMSEKTLKDELRKIADTICRMIDPDVFVWIDEKRKPLKE